MNKDCSKLRVLFVGPYPPPFGGIASLIQLLIPGLKRLSAQDIAVLSFGKINKTKQIEGVCIYRYILKSQIWRILFPWNWMIVFKTILTFRSYNLGLKMIVQLIIKTIIVNKISNKHRSNVVSFYQSNDALEILSSNKIWGAKRGIVLEIFGEIYTDESKEFILDKTELFQKLMEIPSVVTASSQHCAKSFELIGISRPVEVIYIGVDLPRFYKLDKLRDEYREKMNYKDDICLFLFLGRFNTEMGLNSFINTIPAVIKKNKRVRFILAGATGPLVKEALECEKKFPDFIDVMIDAPYELLPSLYAAADIVCTPSKAHRACMGITIKEAMAASKPVVGTNSGGIPEAIVHNETGLIVPHKEDGETDVVAYIKTMLYLANSPDLKISMGKKARLRAEEMFSEETTVSKTVDIFLSCISHD